MKQSCASCKHALFKSNEHYGECTLHWCLDGSAHPIISKDWTCGSDCKDYYCYEKLAEILAAHAAEVERLTAERDCLDKHLADACREVAEFTMRTIAAERKIRRYEKEQKAALERFSLLVARPDGEQPETLEEVADILLRRCGKISDENMTLRADRDAALARAERAEACLRRVQRLADDGVDDPAGPHNVMAQIANTVETVLSSPPADASKMVSDQPADPYSGELGNINFRNLAARMHAALGLLKRQGCYHSGMDSMREEGFKHGLNIGDMGPEDHIPQSGKMVGERERRLVEALRKSEEALSAWEKYGLEPWVMKEMQEASEQARAALADMEQKS